MEGKLLGQSLSALFSQSKPFVYKKGEAMHRPDDLHKGVYFIEKGIVKAYSISKTGSEHLHIIYKPGEMFPLRWAFLDIPGKTFYEALTPVVLRRIPKDVFLKAVASDPVLAQEFIKKLIDIFDMYVMRVDNLQHTTSHRRLIAMLLFLAKRFGVKEGEKVTIDIVLTHQEMGNLINMARETISREFEALIQKEILSMHGQHIVINDIVNLKKSFHI